jgi:hypothetical protein
MALDTDNTQTDSAVTGAAPTITRPSPKGATIMQTNARDMSREERRALLERRRSAVPHQLRRLAIELTDLDRQLDDIEQSEAEASALQGHTNDQ